MKIPPDIKLHPGKEYCEHCFHSSVQIRQGEDGKKYTCLACHAVSDRRVSTDGRLRWWLDDERNLWHESAGIFVFNREGRFLCFELTKFPFGFTIPAGHGEEGEESEEIVKRELLEETGLHAEKLRLLGDADIAGDSCSRGADHHRWHAFVGSVVARDVHIDPGEGKNPAWLSLEDALEKNFTVPTRYSLDSYKDDLEHFSNESRGEK